MTVSLTAQESEQIFEDILCNCISMGYIAGYGIELQYDSNTYIKERDTLNRTLEYTTPTYEDVLMAMLRSGHKLIIKDIEGDGDYDSIISLHDIHTKIQNAPVSLLLECINGEGDVITYDVVLQHMLYGEVIFG